MTSRFLARAAVYAALYAALTLAPGLSSFAYGQVQFRVSEGLMAFACFDPAAVVGLTAGTLIANVASPIGWADVVFGTLWTLIAATIMWFVGARLAALAVPVVVNGFGVAAELTLVQQLPYWPSVGFVSLGELTVLATAGVVIFGLARRYGGELGFSRQRREV